MHGTLLQVNPPTPGVAAVSLRYVVAPEADDWVLTEDKVPESVPHDSVAEHLKQLLDGWIDRGQRNLRVARNLAIRWLERRPQIGVDPDLCLLDPPPPEVEELLALCLWKPGHAPPSLCFEIVSRNHPHKDYSALQDRYAAWGCRELVIFDPHLAGPKALGGPVPLQVWQRNETNVFERVHFGAGAFYCNTLDAWLQPRGRKLELSDDRAGERLWQTREVEFREQAERERTEKESLQRQLRELQARTKSTT